MVSMDRGILGIRLRVSGWQSLLLCLAYVTFVSSIQLRSVDLLLCSVLLG